jgi:putative DNA primase/helicase
LGGLKQFIVIFSGQGRNGKDTLMSIIQYILGLSLAAPIPAELILDGGINGKRSSQGPSADLMKLRGLRLASANETSQGKSFNSGVAKQLSGGGLMTARAPFGRANVDWEMTHLIILMTNHKPKAPVDDYAFWKRIKPIHFPLSFVSDPKEPHERKADPNIGEKLKAEASGILNFLIQGCLDYQKYGLKESAAIKAEHSAYLKDVDLTGIFLDDCCLQKHTATVPAKDLYAAYRAWAQENGYRPISGKAFGHYISKRFEAGHTRNGNFYSGIGLLSCEGCEGL